MSALWITLALLVAGFAGWPVTALVFRLARTIDDRSDSRADGGASADNPSADSTVDGEITLPAASPAPRPASAAGAVEPAVEPTVEATVGTTPAAPGTSTRILRGGAIIGVLERLAVCMAILTGQPVAIAYVVAIKGLGRFAELKETPVAAERFIIGTLTSMLWAAGVAALTKVIFLG
ncbi:hypothetical protein AB4Y86_06835 [Arthrobacter sp. 2YAF22_2]|uniref:hypothetical protein n=1 Tax=Arthrobacter sp. 2YAF22_2 TaxID=3233029 RepID=UPI003F93E4FC